MCTTQSTGQFMLWISTLLIGPITFTRPSTRSRSWIAWANVSWRKLQKMLRKRRWVTAASRCTAVTTSLAPSAPPVSTDRGKNPYTAGVQLANRWRHESRLWYSRFFVSRAWAWWTTNMKFTNCSDHHSSPTFLSINEHTHTHAYWFNSMIF